MEAEKVDSEYFHLIRNNLLIIKMYAPWADQVLDQVVLLIMDISFIEVFCFFFDTLDEESMGKLRSIITPFKLIWPEEYKQLSLLKRLSEKSPIDMLIQDFHSAIVELKEKFMQSKQQIEGWCEKFMHSSMNCHSSTLFRIRYYLEHIRYCLDLFSEYRAAEIVPLKKGIDILAVKITLLIKSLNNTGSCTITKEILQFRKFALAFVNNSACLALIYWSKEDNEETAGEMNIFLFDMLQNFIPWASDIIPLYIYFLKSFDLQTSDSFLLGEAVESFVGLFFDHMDTILKEDFLILSDRLTILFTFFIDPSCVNVEEEELIRSQISALFHVDEYLKLPFHKMKDDFSDKRILLDDCMIKIDMTIAKIRELDCGFTDTWIKVDEVKKLEYVYFVPIQRELSWIEKHAQRVDPVLKGQLRLYKTELRFLRVFLLCFTTWDDADEEIRERLSSMITTLYGIWEEKEEGLLAHRLHTIRTGGFKDWQPLAFELKGKIQLSKLEIGMWWLNLFHLSFRCKPLTSYKVLKCLDAIMINLNDLVSYKNDETVPFKKQIEIFKEKVSFFKIFLKLALNCINGKNLDKFNMFVQVFANDATCLTFLYWTKDTNDKISSKTDSILSHMLQKIKPVTYDVARLYFETFKVIYLQGSDSHLFGQISLSFVDLFLDDCFQNLRDDILFLLTFLNDPPNMHAKELVCRQIDTFFWEGVYGLLPFDDIEGDFSNKKVLQREFMTRIETVNTNIRQAHCKFPDSSIYNFPKIISPRFLDFLIHNLRNMNSDKKFVPFAKYKIITIEEELVSLSPFFNHIFNLQSENNETWLEVVNLLHLTEHVINACISSRFIFDHPIWYHMAYLSYVIDEIKVVMGKLEKVEENTEQIFRCPPRLPGFIPTPSEQERSSKVNDIVVGFEDEAKIIIRELTWGRSSFDIVSIVGMGGIGKTTLAKLVYGSSTVKDDFNVFAFCYVSQNYSIRKVFIDILYDINGVDYGNSDMTDYDLADKLRKCLSRQKYLIVLDDIWHISIWNEIRSSFPDHKNGSKVMITTRSHEVANKCKITCTPYEMQFISAVKSWELLRKKVFDDGIAPPRLYEIGMKIAKSCKGLPLAVVVISGLLARKEKSLWWWNEVAERLVSYLYDEGCMRILELSFEHLPDTLKPCLLYLGAYPKDELIRAKHLILLWIAEGFIQESKTLNIEDVAKVYFRDLVDRSLIIVGSRNSYGEIKTFRVHGLIHDLCRTKCQDTNFFYMNRRTASSNSSSYALLNNQYRISMQRPKDVMIVDGASCINAHSVLYFDEKQYYSTSGFAIRDFRLAQVLDLNLGLRQDDLKQLASLVHLRHVHARFAGNSKYIPSSISNLWNLQSFMLISLTVDDEIYLPENFWEMKSLRHVKIDGCILELSDCHDNDAYPQLDNLVSFSNPCLSNGKDVQHLLQRLPTVGKLSCCLKNSVDYDEELVETLDFHRKLESLKLTQLGKCRKYLINFPSTLTKFTLVNFHLPWTAISSFAELQCLQVLKLRSISFMEPRLEMEDITFPNLKFFELHSLNLVEWNASIESLPCLEQLVIQCPKLEGLPTCFEESSTLKRIVVRESLAIESSALHIKEEQSQLGIQVDVLIYNGNLEFEVVPRLSRFVNVFKE